MIAAPTIAEITDVAGLVPGIGGSAAIGYRHTAAPARDKFFNARFFYRRNARIVGIAQYIQMKTVAETGGIQPGKHRLQVADYAFRDFVSSA